MSESAFDDSPLLRPSPAQAPDQWLATRPEFGPKSGVDAEPVGRQPRPRMGRAERDNALRVAGAKVILKPSADRSAADRALLKTIGERGLQMKAESDLAERDSRTLPATVGFTRGDSSRVKHEVTDSLVSGARSVAEPIAEDAAGERAEDDGIWANQMASYRDHVRGGSAAELQEKDRAAREARASRFQWSSPSTWGIFKNFGWAKKANARRQMAELDEQMGGTAPKVGPWRSGRYRAPKANDPNLHKGSAYSLTHNEARAWKGAIPAATRFEQATTQAQQQSATADITRRAGRWNLDAGAFGKLVTGAAVKTPEQKQADAAAMSAAIARSRQPLFSHGEGDVVSGHAILGAPTRDEGVPDIVRDVFGMDGGASGAEVPAAEAQPSSASAESDQLLNADEPEAVAAQPAAPTSGLRRLNTIDQRL